MKFKTGDQEFSDIDQLVQKLFGDINMSENIQLTLDNGTTEHDIFKTLGQILTHGIVHCYGEDIELNELNQDQINFICQRFEKIGYKIHINPQFLQSKMLRYKLVFPIPKDNPQSSISVAFQSLR